MAFMKTFNFTPKPFVKWAGGKTQACSQFKDRGLIPIKFGTYFEPFLGGGALFLYLRVSKTILSDNNEELINAYRVIKSYVFDLIEILKNHKKGHNKEYYYKIRSLDPQELTNVDRAARLIYLNKTCYNGLYRVNSKGKFNVPIGRYKNPAILEEENLIAIHELLKNPDIKIQVADFEECEKEVERNDFVYFDPPYSPLSETANFTAYTKECFGQQEQIRLANLFKKLSDRGCFVLLSNSDIEFIRNLYSEFYIHKKIMVPRFISSNPNRRKAIGELAITNYQPKIGQKTLLEKLSVPE